MKTMVSRNLILVGLIVFTSFYTTFSQEKKCIKIGMNLTEAGIYDYGDHAFVDIFKRHYEWQGTNANASWVKKDVNGYPIGLPQSSSGQTLTKYIAKLPNGAALPEVTEVPEYTLMYDGKGEISISNIGPLEMVSHDRINKRMVLKRKSGTSQGNTMLTVTASDPTDHLRNIRIIMKGHENTYQQQPFNPQFLEFAKKFNTLRFMDWCKANWNMISRKERPAIEKWSERNTPTSHSHLIKSGIPYEYMIKLCNTIKRNPWVCIPHHADEDYIRQMARLFRDSLDPDLTLYIEYSNELWNFAPAFGQSHWANNEFPDDPNPLWNPNFGDGMGFAMNLGLLHKRAFKAFHGEFGKDTNRVVRVIAPGSWVGNYTYGIIRTLGAENFDAISESWYAGTSKTDWPFPSDVTAAQVVASARKKFFTEKVHTLKQNIEISRALKKKFINYEGGQHIVKHSGDNIPNDLLLQAQVHQDLYDLYDDMLDSLEAWGSEMAVGFSSASGTGQSVNYGTWGSLTSVYKPTSKTLTPKYQALIDNMKNCDIIYEPKSDSIGPGLSLKFDGANDYIESSQVFMPNDNTDDYTMEAWIKPSVLNYRQTILAYSWAVDDNYPANEVRIGADNKINWYVSGGGATNVIADISGPLVEVGKWYHIAAVKKGNVYQLFVNGVAVGNKIASISGNFSRSKFSIGGLITKSGNKFFFRGEIDDVRIWKEGITDERKIRDWMCRKLTSRHPDYAKLDSYFRFDNVGTDWNITLDRKSGKTANLKNFSFGDKSNYQLSGAPIGDDSRNIYPASGWINAGLSYTHSEGDNFSISNLGNGNPNGAHIYVVNQAPNSNVAPANYEKLGTKRYYGVFVATVAVGTNPTYDLSYNYSGNPDAINENKNRLVKRDNNSDLEWRHSGAEKDEIANTLSLQCRETYKAEYILGLRNSTYVRRPGPGKAIRMNGNRQYLEIVPYLRPNDDWTITTWIKGTGSIIRLESSVLTRKLYYYTNYAGTKAELREAGYERDFSLNGTQVSGGVDLNPNGWNHVALVKQGNTFKIYTNGILTGNYPANTNIVPKHKLYIGRGEESWNPHRDFEGEIDELAVWNGAFSQTEIRDWMCKKINKNHPRQCKDLITYFNFDENSGTVLEDRMGPYDAVLRGAVFVNSSAPIGDESAHSYSAPYNVSLSHADGDKMSLTNVSSAAKGAHLYLVNEAPKNSSYPSGMPSRDTTRYWGVFTLNAGGTATGATYSVKYDYDQNVNVKEDANVRLLTRADNSSIAWASNPTAPVGPTITLTNRKVRDELMLGGTTASAINIDLTPPVKPVISGPTTACSGQENLKLSVQKDPKVYVYKWEIPSGLNGFSDSSNVILTAGTQPGSYEVKVKAIDKFGKESEMSNAFTIEIKATPATPFVINGDDAVCGAGSSANYSVGSPEAGVTHSWSVSNGTAEPEANTVQALVTFTGPATSLITVKASNGACTSNPGRVKSITIGNPGSGSNIAVGDGAACSGSLVNISVGPSTLNTVKYQAFNGVNPISSEVEGNGGQITLEVNTLGMIPGINEVVVKAKSSTCTYSLIDKAKINITDGGMNSITATGNNICSGANGIVTLSGTNTGETYKAFLQDNTEIALQGTAFTIPNATLAEGPNIITVKYTNSNCGNSERTLDTAMVILKPGPSKDLSVIGDTVCSGNNAEVSVKLSQPGVSYQPFISSNAIGTPEVGTGGTLTFTIPGISLSQAEEIISIKATLAECSEEVELTQKANVFVNEAINKTVNLVGDTVCIGALANIKIQGQNGISYQAFKNGEPIGNEVVSAGGLTNLPIPGLPRGLHNIRVLASTEGCASDSLDGQPKVLIDGEVDLNLTTEGSIVCEGSPATVTIRGTQNTVQYQAFLNGSAISEMVESNANNSTIVLNLLNTPFVTQDLYLVTIKATGLGCKGDSLSNNPEIEVKAKPSEDFIIGTSTICSGSNALLNITNSSSGISYIGIVGNLPVDTSDVSINGEEVQLSVPASKMKPGDNIIKLKALSEACGAFDLAKEGTVTVIGANMDLPITGSEVCPGQDPYLTIETSQTGATYKAYLNGHAIGEVTSQGGAAVITMQRQSFNPGANTPVNVKVFLSAQCPETEMMLVRTVKVLFAPKENLIVIGDTLCTYAKEAIVEIKDSEIGIKYSAIIHDNVVTSAEGNGGNVFINLPLEKINSQKVEVIVEAEVMGCSSKTFLETKASIIKGTEVPTPEMSGSEVLCLNEKAVYLVKENEEVYTYEWVLPAGLQRNVPENSASIETALVTEAVQPNSYVEVAAVKGKCKSKPFKLAVNMRENCPNIFIPNVLSLGDNNSKTSVWNIEGIEEFPEAKIKIFNRWGGIIYEYNNGYTKPWDGKSQNGEEVPTATYYYVIDLKSFKKTYNGSITVVR